MTARKGITTNLKGKAHGHLLKKNTRGLTISLELGSTLTLVVFVKA